MAITGKFTDSLHRTLLRDCITYEGFSMNDKEFEAGTSDAKSILRWIAMPFMATLSAFAVLIPLALILFIFFKIHYLVALFFMIIGFPVAMFLMGSLYVSTTIRFSPSNKKQASIIMLAIAAFGSIMNFISGLIQVSSGRIDEMAGISTPGLIFGFGAVVVANLIYLGGAYYKLKKSFPNSEVLLG
jgi:hypothetical protein